MSAPQIRLQGELPVLVAVSHGTRSPAGRATIARLRLAVGALRPELEVLAAHVDVQPPTLDAVVGKLTAAGRACVVVPLLLSTGYHVRHDVTRAVRASGGLALAAAALGPDGALVDVLIDRLAEAGAGPQDAVVLAAAGSLSPRAAADVEEVVAALAARRAGTGSGTAPVVAPVVAGYASAQSPTVPEAVAALRGGNRSDAAHPDRRVVVAPYLLAPGVFSQRLAEVGADAVAAPLGVDGRIAALALRRYDEARSGAVSPGVGPGVGSGASSGVGSVVSAAAAR